MKESSFTRTRFLLWPTLGLTAPAVFVLPLLVPVPFAAANSASYLVGFNNRVADLLVVFLGALVVLLAWRLRSLAARVVVVEEGRPIGWRLVLGVVAITTLVLAGSGYLVGASHLRYLSDAGYFLEQATAHADTGRALYSGLEFAYGPLLFYPTLWVRALVGCSLFTAYFVTLIVSQSLGIGLLAILMNGIPMRGRDRRFAFCLLCFGALNPLLGLNYTLLRFATPFALLLFASRSVSWWRSAGWFVAGELLLLGISPEQAMAFVAATAVFAVLRRSWRERLATASLVGGQVLAAIAFVRLAGPGYLGFFHVSALGAFNLPVAPYPHILIYLLMVVWLVPSACGALLQNDDPRGRELTAQYALALALVPAALGRCDPIHVFFNSVGLTVLALAALSGQSPRRRAAGITVLFVFVFWQQWVNQRVYFPRTMDTIRLVLLPHLSPTAQAKMVSALWWLPPLQRQLKPFPMQYDSQYQLNVPALEHRVGHAPVATPLEINPLVETALRRSGHYRPDYYVFTTNVLDRGAEAAKIASLNRAQWALLPGKLEGGFLEKPNDLQNLQGFNFPYRVRHQVPFYPRAALLATIRQQWMEVCDLGPYTLYHHQPPPADYDDLPAFDDCQ